jgi:predicted enzyme involved in methoxymalonyl-ACP biosynthesis
MSINVVDKFGDYGLVGAVIIKKEEDSLFLDSLILSVEY